MNIFFNILYFTDSILLCDFLKRDLVCHIKGRTSALVFECAPAISKPGHIRRTPQGFQRAAAATSSRASPWGAAFSTWRNSCSMLSIPAGHPPTDSDFFRHYLHRTPCHSIPYGQPAFFIADVSKRLLLNIASPPGRGGVGGSVWGWSPRGPAPQGPPPPRPCTPGPPGGGSRAGG